MNDQLISQVEDLGLSNKEARVYVANLMTGPAGVQQIADASGIKRVTTYVILESLVNLGLVSQTTKAKKTLFNAESPANLRRLLDKREQSILDQKQSLEELIPELSNLTTVPKDAPSVKLYDGVEGLQSLIRDYISEHGKKDGVRTVYGMSNLDLLYKLFPKIEENEGNADRFKTNVSSKFLYSTDKGAILADTDKQRNRESRWLPAREFPITCDISIVGDSVVLMSLEGTRPIGVTIQSGEIANSLKTVFDLAWRSAEQYNQK